MQCQAWGRLVAQVSAQTLGLGAAIGVIALGANPITSSTASAASPTTEADFWQQAQSLTQDQINFIALTEAAAVSPDPNRVRVARGQLVLHIGTIERFLRRHAADPNSLCLENPTEDVALTPPQQRVYCNLYFSAQELWGLQPKFNRRLRMLANQAELNPLALVSGETRLNSVGAPVFERGSLREPARPRYAPAPDLPDPKPPIVGRAAKPILADYTPPFPPALTVPPDIAKSLNILTALVTDSRNQFPPQVSFTDPAEMAQIMDTNAYAFYPQEQQVYAQFLSNPNTGMARLLPAAVYRQDPNVLHNRLLPTVAEKFPFAPLIISATNPPPQMDPSWLPRLAPQEAQRYGFMNLPARRTEAFVPRLTLQIEGDRVQLVQKVDYGFLADVGPVPLEALNADLNHCQLALSPQSRQFFLTYRPPTTLEALQVDRRRFLLDEGRTFNLPETIAATAPLQVNHTYLLRTLQFDLPEPVRTGRAVPETERRALPLQMELQSRDLLVAFQPVRQRPDGSYTVLWRVLAQFPDPQIEDIDQFVRF
ncbi:hypothetical protein [Trichothermofontia sp.]